MKYLGVLVMLIGVLLLMKAGFVPSENDNFFLGFGLLLVVGGYLAHIFVSRKVID